MSRLTPLVAVVFLFLAACSPPQNDVKAIVGAKMGEWSNTVVLVDKGKVTAAGRQQDVPVPKGSQTTSGLGGTIEPALKVGDAATFTLKGSPGTPDRSMRDGEWAK